MQKNLIKEPPTQEDLSKLLCLLIDHVDNISFRDLNAACDYVCAEVNRFKEGAKSA